MGRMLQPRYRVSLLFSSRQLDRNAAGRGRHQLMVDGGNHPGKLKPTLKPTQNQVQFGPFYFNRDKIGRKWFQCGPFRSNSAMWSMRSVLSTSVHFGPFRSNKVKSSNMTGITSINSDRDAEPLVRELCDIWEWTEENVSSQTCQGVDRLDEIPPYTSSLNWP